MPELPDLQVFSKNLTKKLSGKTVTKVEVPVTKKLNVTVPQLKKVLEGNVVHEVVRDGKELHMHFRDGAVLGLHLMLHGQMFIDDDKEERKSAIIRLTFEDDTIFTMTDFQKQAVPTLDPEAKSAEDALSKKVNAAFLKQGFSESKLPVKSWLMDQKMIRGIGNAYADEILWKAKVSPFSISNKIPAAQVTKIAAAIKSVLKNAEKEIMKATPDIISGELRDFLAVHHSKKEKTPTGAKIRKDTLGGRGTYFTDEQVFYK